MWGADGRSNVGYGLWQLAYASKEGLDLQAYADARASMQSQRTDGKPLVIRAAELWVPPRWSKPRWKSSRLIAWPTARAT